MLPSSVTVARHLTDVATKQRSTIAEKLKEVTLFGVTTDLWTHDKTGLHYISVTAQNLELDFTMQSTVLATRSVEDKHTGDCIRQMVVKVLEEFNANRGNNVFVTDNASNMKSAFKDLRWLGCSCHNLNLALVHSFEKPKPSTKSNDDEEEEGMPVEVLQLIDTCKELVTLAKRTTLNGQLETTLKQCVPTRWNSILTTLKSVSNNLAELRVISASAQANRSLLRLLADINEDLLSEMIRVLDSFDVATKLLSADSKPSLHLVLPTKHRLMNQLVTRSTDSYMISQMKSRISNNVQRYFVVANLHYVAALLDPRLKNKREIFKEDNYTTALSMLRQLVQEVSDHAHDDQAAYSQEPLTKKPRLQNDVDAATSFYGDLFDIVSTENEVLIVINKFFINCFQYILLFVF